MSPFASHDLLWQNGQSNLSWSFVRCKRPAPQYLASTCNHLGKERWNLGTDFSHSSEKNLPKKISPQLKLDFGIPNLFMTLFFLHCHPTLKTEGIPSHMGLFQRRKYHVLAICVGIPRAGWWNSPLIFTYQTSNILQNGWYQNHRNHNWWKKSG